MNRKGILLFISFFTLIFHTPFLVHSCLAQTINADTDVIKASTINSLMSDINTKRSNCNMPAYPWTDSSVSADLTVIKASHINDMRAAIKEVYDRIPGASVSFSDDPVQADVTPIKASHINELRTAVDSATTCCGDGICNNPPEDNGNCSDDCSSSCTYGGWIDDGCGINGCQEYEMSQKNSAPQSGCPDLYQCIDDGLACRLCTDTDAAPGEGPTSADAPYGYDPYNQGDCWSNAPSQSGIVSDYCTVDYPSGSLPELPSSCTIREYSCNTDKWGFGCKVGTVLCPDSSEKCVNGKCVPCPSGQICCWGSSDGHCKACPTGTVCCDDTCVPCANPRNKNCCP